MCETTHRPKKISVARTVKFLGVGQGPITSTQSLQNLLYRLNLLAEPI